MKFSEFGTIAMTIKTVYPGMKMFDSDEGISIWYELLKDIEYGKLSKAVSEFVKTNSFPPTIADLRRYVNIISGNDWSVSWNKLKNGAKLSDIDYPGQYAYMTIGQKIFDESGEFRIMIEFQKLYREFSLMDNQVKKELFKTGMLVWRKEDRVALDQRKKVDELEEIGFISGS